MTMAHINVVRLIETLAEAGGRVTIQDGKPVLLAHRPIPSVLTEQLLAHRSEILEYLTNGSPAMSPDPVA